MSENGPFYSSHLRNIYFSLIGAEGIVGQEKKRIKSQKRTVTFFTEVRALFSWGRFLLYIYILRGAL